MSLRTIAPSGLTRLIARLSMAGMSLAVIALAGLAVWSGSQAQEQADGLTSVGVQITGQLRAVQALYQIRVTMKDLEGGVTDERMARVNAARQTLPRALARMQAGHSPEETRVARQAQPVALAYDQAIQRYLDDPNGEIRCGCDEPDKASEDAMKDAQAQLERLLNDSDADPAQLLSSRLANATAAGRTVHRAVLVLGPLGLVSVIIGAWLLRAYRRRCEAANQAVLELAAQDARTDQLTGLPNRRALLEELDRRVLAGETFVLALADLNGFKHYNDTYGHPAGDALLRRLGHNLDVAWEGKGFAARLGGDEFCVLAANLDPEQLQTRLHDALTEEGEGFSISAVSGLATLPTEATTPTAALALADSRLYTAKAAVHSRLRRAPVPSGPDVTGSHPEPDTSPLALSRLLEGTHPGLGSHLDRVAQLAVACAETLGLSADQILSIEQAAQVYDIGKSAVPAAILAKRGNLTAEEEQFVHHHSVIGQRLLSTMDILEPASAIVRATPERWDGTGYPDQLAGQDIPIGARIVAVADAFCAMTSDRPDGAARSLSAALGELDRCSGTHFDPAVVAAMAKAATNRHPAEAHAHSGGDGQDRQPGGGHQG